MNHLTPEEAARWVAGLLDSAQVESMEAHARACTRCEALLQAEARAEMKLARAVEGLAPTTVLRPRFRWALLAAPLALAAALALTFREEEPLDERGAADAGVSAEQADRTHFEGELPPAEAFEARTVFEL